ncbi:MAG: hypothetical protein Kow0059_18760 [Candidatus Sumerlaeia bacterium]
MPPVAPPVLKVFTHRTWEAHPPVGYPADAMRRNLQPDSSFEFKGLTLTLHKMWPGEGGPDTASDRASITLSYAPPDAQTGAITEDREVREGEAFNWRELFHIAVPAIRTTKGELGYGVTEFEVAWLASLPPELARSTTAGDATLRLRIPHKINKITLHHSATPLKPGDDFPKKLRALQTWGQKERNWWDVPYHFFVDLDGQIWQGRDFHFMGETNTTYNPWGYFLINCYGNYEEMEPNEKQIEAIVNLMAWACAEFGVPPTEIYGHRDLAETSCPGKNLYRYLQDGTLKTRVAARLTAGAPKLIFVDEQPVLRSSAAPHRPGD